MCMGSKDLAGAEINQRLRTRNIQQCVCIYPYNLGCKLDRKVENNMAKHCWSMANNAKLRVVYSGLDIKA